MLNKLLKSVLDQDLAPVVVCDIDDIIVYMNPSAVERYHKDLTGKSIKDCHPPKANEMIDKVVAWFKESKDNNIIYTYRNDEENKDVYMVALRDETGTLQVVIKDENMINMIEKINDLIDLTEWKTKKQINEELRAYSVQ